jgi:hypothetical protein
VDVEQILAFRLARSGLASRHAGKVAEAAACPVSDFSRDAALMAFAARHEDLTREAYDEAVDSGDLVLAHVVRGAIHAVAPDEFALYGRALVSSDDDELGLQLGRQVQRLAAEKGFAPTDALDEVAEATSAALAMVVSSARTSSIRRYATVSARTSCPGAKDARATTWRRCCGATDA